MPPLANRLVAALALALASSFGGSARAESAISWGVPQNITGDSDVSSVGTLYYAYYTSTNASDNTTVNGVDFVKDGNSGSFIITNGINGFTGSYGYYGSTQSPFTGLSAGYQALLSSGANTSSSTASLTYINLTAGDTYQVQFWVNDSRDTSTYPVLTGRAETIGDSVGGSISSQLVYNTSGIDGGLGQFITGTFIADSTGQETFNFVATASNLGVPGAQFNGTALNDISAVPEPSSVAMVSCGLMLAMFAAYRRRRSSKS